MATPRIEVTEPKVVRRVYKVQYAPQTTETRMPSRQRGSSKRDGSISKRKASMKAYDRSTDNDIFALGSAFKSGNFDIDDFLSSFKSNAVVSQTDAQGNNLEVAQKEVTQGDDLAEWSTTPKSMITTMVGPTLVTRRKRIITTIANSDNDGNKIVKQTTQVFMPDGCVIEEESSPATHNDQSALFTPPGGATTFTYQSSWLPRQPKRGGASGHYWRRTERWKRRVRWIPWSKWRQWQSGIHNSWHRQRGYQCPGEKFSVTPLMKMKKSSQILSVCVRFLVEGRRRRKQGSTPCQPGHTMALTTKVGNKKLFLKPFTQGRQRCSSNLVSIHQTLSLVINTSSVTYILCSFK